MSTYKNSYTARDERARFIIHLVTNLMKDQDKDFSRGGAWYFRVVKLIEEETEFEGHIHTSAEVTFETDEDYDAFYKRLKKALRGRAEDAYLTLRTLKPTIDFNGVFNNRGE